VDQKSIGYPDAHRFVQTSGRELFNTARTRSIPCVGSGRVDPCFLIGRVELGFFKLGRFFGFALGYCGFGRVFVKNHNLRCIDRVESGWVFFERVRSSRSGRVAHDQVYVQWWFSGLFRVMISTPIYIHIARSLFNLIRKYYIRFVMICI
jgi:hypothetical protein